MNVTGNKITPDEGKYLTQSDDVNDNNRLYTTELLLGSADAVSNWREADASEKEEFDKRMAEMIENGAKA